MNDFWRVALLCMGLVWLLAVLAIVGPGEPAHETVATVTIVDGDRLWDLAGELGEGYDRRAWVARCCELNGWEVAPNLRIGQVVRVPDWRGDGR